MAKFLSFLLLYALSHSATALPPLQLYVELTPDGGVLKPEPGRYSGPVVLSRAITIDGQGEVIIDAEGEGSVLTIEADNVILRGLHITHSGDSFDKAHAGITIKADKVLVEDNVIDNTLFGVNILGGNDNIIRKNTISSIDTTLSLRGDGLRMWNAHDNLIEDNKFLKVRDIYVTNSLTNRFINNHIQHSRIGFEFIFSHENEIVGNTVEHNNTGMVFVYSNDNLIEKNHIGHLRSFAGSAMAFKETYGIKILDNRVLHCAIGLSANAPLDPENKITLMGNEYIYNDVALYFYGEKGGHIIHNNRFKDNITDVQASVSTASFYNDWQSNYWDTYEGFDNDEDGIGDTSFELYSWSSRLWVDMPMTQFFRGSPLLETIDFVERLASFSDPVLMVRDKSPRIR
ncbi:MAG: nitrous oxide reductase family maturation protein NosD [Gammaproteobacteria bacterium]|nr:nitrous oxide reductase family maturation protein NosD [Gammaproteobacteria bacterium]